MHLIIKGAHHRFHIYFTFSLILNQVSMQCCDYRLVEYLGLLARLLVVSCRCYIFGTYKGA